MKYNDKPTPPNSATYDKIKHLPLASQKRVLELVRQLAPKHNAEVMWQREQMAKVKKT